jgi:hypothetical protein
MENSANNVPDGDRPADGFGETEIVRGGECDSDAIGEIESVAGRLAGFVCGGEPVIVSVGL